MTVEFKKMERCNCLKGKWDLVRSEEVIEYCWFNKEDKKHTKMLFKCTNCGCFCFFKVS